MNSTFPFSILESLGNRLQPPVWVIDEAQRRLVLFLNHVLMQEKEAQDRLARKKGNVVHMRWGLFVLDLLITPAGLVDRASPSAQPDLRVVIAGDSPLALFQSVLDGKRPAVTIEGDVQLAAELGWLAENLRWDVEEDLSRVVGDIPAHALADAGRRLLAGLKQFASMWPSASASSAAKAQAPAHPSSTPSFVPDAGKAPP